ncbi:LOW QUALITY PROTEIN: Amyloid-beta A4 precursor protein-binding family A member 2, partial [Plecturocebus cupreus]
MLDHRARLGPVPVPHGQKRRHGSALQGLCAQGPGTDCPMSREPHARGEEGITFYICYYPEDDSYQEGMDCNRDEYWSMARTPWTLICARGIHTTCLNSKAPSPSHHLASASAEAVPGGPFLSGPSAPFSGTGEEWLDSVGLHPYGHCAQGSQDYTDGHLPILEDEPSVLETHEQEEGCYSPEANGNTGASHYLLRHGDEDVEDQEDSDLIMAKIKRNLSMTSITSASQHGPKLGSGDSAEACLPRKASCSYSRHEVKPESLNLPPEAKHHEDPQRGFGPRLGPQREAEVAPRAGRTLLYQRREQRGLRAGDLALHVFLTGCWSI